MNEEQKTALKRLQSPFAKHEISLLPKPYKKENPRGKCDVCGGYHGLPAIHLDYVGHAALTKRLLEVDPLWFWEPFAIGPDGLPQLDKNGGLWIRLTVCGMTRIGYGDAENKTGPLAIKEAIGDALRNAGMRFGMALDLWHKGGLYDADEIRGLTGEPEEEAEGKKPAPITPQSGVAERLSKAEREEMEAMAFDVKRMFFGGQEPASIMEWLDGLSLDPDMKVFMWGLLPSNMRSALKKAKEEMK